jgi:hypothetical protein
LPTKKEYAKNKEYYLQYAKEQRIKINNDPILLERKRQQNREYIQRKKNDPEYRLRKNISNAIYRKIHKEKIRIKNKNYVANNKEKISNRRKKYTYQEFLFIDKRLRIKDREKVREDKCKICNKGIGDNYINYKGEITPIKLLSIHHYKYHKNNPLKDTITICSSCHSKLTWKKRKETIVNISKICLNCSKKFIINIKISPTKKHCSFICKNKYKNKRYKERHKK